MVKLTSLTAAFLLLLASAIWGFAFVAQRIGMEHMGPFTFNGIRFLMGGLVLIPLIGFSSSSPKNTKQHPQSHFFFWSIIAGLALFVGSSFQQMGIVYTQAGNAGFITGLYIIFVPVIDMFLGQRIPGMFWFAMGLAVIGMYLLSMGNGLSLNKGDLLVLVSAVAFAFHVLVIDRAAKHYQALKLSMYQFLICGVFSLAAALFFEALRFSDIQQAAIPILYSGIFSVGAGYTLQTIGQKHVAPGPAAILLSAESVFAVIGGIWLLNETINTREFIGCGLMLLGMILSQQPFFKREHDAIANDGEIDNSSGPSASTHYDHKGGKLMKQKIGKRYSGGIQGRKQG